MILTFSYRWTLRHRYSAGDVIAYARRRRPFAALSRRPTVRVTSPTVKNDVTERHDDQHAVRHGNGRTQVQQNEHSVDTVLLHRVRLHLLPAGVVSPLPLQEARKMSRLLLVESVRTRRLSVLHLRLGTVGHRSAPANQAAESARGGQHGARAPDNLDLDGSFRILAQGAEADERQNVLVGARHDELVQLQRPPKSAPQDEQSGRVAQRGEVE